MKITKNQLKQIIREELSKSINELKGQYSVGADVEKEIDAGTVSASGDLPLYGVEGTLPGSLIGAEITDTGAITDAIPSFTAPSGPRLSAGYSTEGSDKFGLPGGVDVGGKMAMTTGGKVPLMGGEINLSRDIGDYTMKARKTFGNYDLSRGLTGNMVGASLGKNIGDAHFEAGLDMPKGKNGLPSLKQAQVFLQGGGDLGSLSVILGPDLLKTGPGINFQANVFGLARKFGLIKPKPKQKVDAGDGGTVLDDILAAEEEPKRSGPDKTNWPKKLSLPPGGTTRVDETFKRWKKLIK